MNDNMKEDVLRVLLSEDEIREKVRELGGKITADYKNSNLMLVTVLKGAVVFLADLMRQIDVPAAARLTCRRITSASRCRTSSSSATGWITMKNTAICRTSAF